MQTITAHLDTAFRAAVRAAFAIETDPLVAPSANTQFGDYQSNCAMSLAKTVSEKTGQKTNPRAVAEQIKKNLQLGDLATEVSIAGPGFINVRLNPKWVAGQLQSITPDPRLGIERTAAPLKTVVDYAGPNIAKEMQIWHLRSMIIGDALARILDFQGHQVIRQNHVGDWGLQMGMVTYALEQHFAGDEELTLPALEKLYRQISKASEDPAVRRQMAQRTRDLQQTPKDDLSGWRRVRDLTLASAHQIFRKFGLLLAESDVRGESFYSDLYGPMIDELVKIGQAKETEGAIGLFPPGFVNQEGNPRPFIVRSRDGTYQYPTFDLAALRFRVTQLGARRVIYTHDVRQSEHFAMLFATAKMLGWDHGDSGPVTFEYAGFGAILGEDGKPYKSRSGESLHLSAFLDEAEQRARAVVDQKNPDFPEADRQRIAHSVGIGAVKYADLSKDRSGDYVFAWDRMLSMEGNTAPYLQYAHARIKSIIRKSGTPHSALSTQNLLLDTPHELALAKHILRLGEALDSVARELKPHILCTYLYDLATLYSGFYENCPVIQSEEPLRSSRLLLVHLTARTLEIGLDLLGIEHPDQM